MWEMISAFYVMTARTDVIWGIGWWGEKSEIIILPLALASISNIFWIF